MRYLIDLSYILGIICCSLGVFLEFGIGYALICFGVCMIKFALISSYVHRADNVFNDEQENNESS